MHQSSSIHPPTHLSIQLSMQTPSYLSINMHIHTYMHTYIIIHLSIHHSSLQWFITHSSSILSYFTLHQHIKIVLIIYVKCIIYISSYNKSAVHKFNTDIASAYLCNTSIHETKNCFNSLGKVQMGSRTHHLPSVSLLCLAEGSVFLPQGRHRAGWDTGPCFRCIPSPSWSSVSMWMKRD